MPSTTRTTATVLGVCACALATTTAQPAAPTLTRQQRSALRAVVSAVDTPGERPETAEQDWPVHVLRASDGSHYVAFSLPVTTVSRPGQPIVLYVRLATRGAARPAERSAVAEWLDGQRSAPLKPQRGVAFGDMPTFGAGAIAARGPGPQSLLILETERERNRERREAEERERKAALEGESAPRGPNPLLPFEDFETALMLTPDADGRVTLRRSFTSGPGDYDLIVAWTDPSSRDPAAAAQVRRRRLQLPIASATLFGLSSVVLADDVTTRATPYAPTEQAAHPYSIGTMEIRPARDAVLTNDERLALVVQVINARGQADGKPDVAVGFRLFRTSGAAQESMGMLAPQVYNATTLPPDFDVHKGHPLFAAVAVPLRTFKRGSYRVQVMADDRVAGVSASTDATFSIAATPGALLRDAPPLVPPFRRESLLTPPLLEALAAALRPAAAPSPALAQGLASLRAGRFVDLVRADSVEASEQGAREVLRAIGLFALGDTANALAAPLRLAQERNAPVAAIAVVAGAIRAIEARERDALQSWAAAVDAGFDAAALAPLQIESHLRLGEPAQALTRAAATAAGADDGRLARAVAAAHLAMDSDDNAIAVLEAQLARQPADTDAQWLLLHALFRGFARGQGIGASAAGKERLQRTAQTYVAAKGRYAALAEEWAAAVR